MTDKWKSTLTGIIEGRRVEIEIYDQSGYRVHTTLGASDQGRQVIIGDSSDQIHKALISTGFSAEAADEIVGLLPVKSCAQAELREKPRSPLSTALGSRVNATRYHTTQDPRLHSMSRGDTSRGVNKGIIEYLLETRRDLTSSTMLDIPCGQGALISTLRSFFPGADVRGCDLSKPDALDAKDFSIVDASKPFAVFPDKKFDYVFSVSGVMEFDNTLQYFESCHHHLHDGGHFIVTNDNIVTISDRLIYFWLGKLRNFSLFVLQDFCTWKVIPIHNMVRILQDAGFRIQEIKYVSVKPKDWLMLPLAMLVYSVQTLYIQFNPARMALTERRAMYPFKSLLYRHYIIVCEKISA